MAPKYVLAPDDRNHATQFLNQALGAWDGERLPRSMTVWVAGCGTNQAPLLALNFPDATIVATDISEGSLVSSRNLARELGVSNIEFRHQLIEDMEAKASFNYIVCTGVIHHTTDPGRLLKHMSNALRPDGVIELMVYNQFHRIETMAFQHVLRRLSHKTIERDNYEARMDLAKRLIAERPPGMMFRALDAVRAAPEEMVADALLQPIEAAFTIDSLAELLKHAGLRLSLPCPNQFDLASQREEGRWISRILRLVAYMVI